MLGVEYPVMLAGMGGVSFANVCAAVSEAGGFGSLGMASKSPEGIREEMKKVKDQTDKPFGVDLLAAIPESLTRSVEIIIEEGAKAFIAGLGVPGPILKELKDAGVVVISMCGAVRHAVKSEQAGVDIVVAQGTEAGGHTGPVGGMALIPQIVEAVDIPVVAAGAINDGRGLAAALAFGAQGVWVGTRFIASVEANAHGCYKDRIIVTQSYSGKTMRVIANEWTRDWEARQDEIGDFGTQGMRSRDAGVMHALMGDTSTFDPEQEAAAAGQGSGGIHGVKPAGDIVREMVTEAGEVIDRLAGIAAGNYTTSSRQGSAKELVG
jgi:enoyl-[acyl-carrier protein] reductase II